MHSIEFHVDPIQSAAETVVFYDNDRGDPDLVLVATDRPYALGRTFLDAILETFHCTGSEFAFKQLSAEGNERYTVTLAPISYGVYKRLLTELAALRFATEKQSGSKTCMLWEKALEWENLR